MAKTQEWTGRCHFWMDATNYLKIVFYLKHFAVGNFKFPKYSRIRGLEYRDAILNQNSYFEIACNYFDLRP